MLLHRYLGFSKKGEKEFVSEGLPTLASVILIFILASVLNSLRRSASLVVKELSIPNAEMSRLLGIALDSTFVYKFLAPVSL